MCRSRYIPFLLSALVVLCPFHCVYGGCLSSGPGISGCGTDAASSSRCCDHCAQPADSSQDPIPAYPEDCDCADCFCRGALPANIASDNVDATQLATFLSWTGQENIRVAVRGSQVQHSSLSVHPDSSAHEMRAALSCWII